MMKEDIIVERLQQAFTPVYLKVIDDSHRHKGHAGSRDGAGHYTVIIAAEQLSNIPRLAAHREIYRVLHDFIPTQIHALQIQIISP